MRLAPGAAGWYYADWFRKPDGAMDLLMGGSGLCRSRRDSEQFAVGDTVNCMGAEIFEPDHEPGGRIARVGWRSTYPLHRLLFSGMIRRTGASSRRSAGSWKDYRSEKPQPRI